MCESHLRNSFQIWKQDLPGILRVSHKLNNKREEIGFSQLLCYSCFQFGCWSKGEISQRIKAKAEKPKSIRKLSNNYLWTSRIYWCVVVK